MWPRIICKLCYSCFNDGNYLFIQFHYLFLGITFNKNGVPHFAASSISLKACSKGITSPLRVFAWVHYPSLPLMVFTFFMELVFLVAYFKWRNLWALGLYHGWVASLLLFFVLGRDLWNELWTVF
jgi:hypothetical protein